MLDATGKYYILSSYTDAYIVMSNFRLDIEPEGSDPYEFFYGHTGTEQNYKTEKIKFKNLVSDNFETM